MKDTALVQKELSEFFYEDEIEWKIQSFNTKDRKDATKCMIVPYVQARAIMNRLDEIVGIENWKDEYETIGKAVQCTLSLRLIGPSGEYEWVSKQDGAEQSQVESVKGGYSDSLKRAAVKWGIGRYLYSTPKFWVALDQDKKPKSWPSMPRHFLPADAMNNGNRPGSTGSSNKEDEGHTESETKKEETTKSKVEKKQPAQKATAPSPAPNGKPADEDILWAKQINVPTGVPLAGSTLGTAMQDPTLGKFLVEYLAGVKPKADGTYFEVKNEKLEDVSKAANILLATL